MQFGLSISLITELSVIDRYLAELLNFRIERYSNVI
jgi:hypothetical protein